MVDGPLWSRSLALRVLLIASAAITTVVSAPVQRAWAEPFAYIANYGEHSISVVDIATNEVIETIDTFQDIPTGVAAAPDGERVYVLMYEPKHGSDIIGSDEHIFVRAYETATHTEVRALFLGTVISREIAVSVDSETYFVTFKHYVMNAIDAHTDARVAITTGGSNTGLAVHPDGTVLYVADGSGDEISVVDLDSMTEIDNIELSGACPWGLAVSPDGTRVYAAMEDSDEVAIIDTATNEEIGTVSVGNYPVGVAIDPDGTRLFVSNYRSNTVSVVDTATNLVIDTISVPAGPWGIDVTPTGSRVYVVCNGTGQVVAIDADSYSMIDIIEVGDHPRSPGSFITPQGVLEARPDFRNFGNVDAGDESDVAVFTFTTTAPLTVGSVSYFGADKDDFNPNFETSTPCTDGLELAGGEECTVDVTFTPQSGGVKSASIRVPFEGAESGDLQVELRGTGIGPTIVVSDPTPPGDDGLVDFGRVVKGQSTTLMVEILNYGNEPLADLSCDGLEAPFSIAAPPPGRTDCCNPATVVIPWTGAATDDEVCAFSVAFAPPLGGEVAEYWGELSISSNALEPVILTVEGMGVADPDNPDIFAWDQILPMTDFLLDFGNFDVGDIGWCAGGYCYIRLRNVGSYNPTHLMVTDLELSGEHPDDFIISTPPHEINPDYCGPEPPYKVFFGTAYCDIQVQFAPLAPGDRSATFEIFSNDPDEPVLTYTLRGRGIGAAMAVDDGVDPPDDLDVPFGQVIIGNSISADVLVVNTGNLDWGITDLGIEGDTAFSLDTEDAIRPCVAGGDPLGERQFCNLAVNFQPTATGLFSATLSIDPDHVDLDPVEISISGEGVEAALDEADDVTDAGGDVEDVGPPDAGDVEEMGPPDAGDVEEMGPPDAGDVEEMGPPDAGDVEEMGPPDAADVEEMGPPDAADVEEMGPPDAADVEIDPAVQADLSITDASSEQGERGEEGCGCTQGRGLTWYSPWVALLFLVWRRKPDRRPRSHPDSR